MTVNLLPKNSEQVSEFEKAMTALSLTKTLNKRLITVAPEAYLKCVKY